MTERLFVRLDGDPLYAPETSVPAGTLREFEVPLGLRRWVAHLITYEEDFRAGERVHERVLPDGSLHLVFELDDGPVRSRLAGPRLAPAMLVMQGHVRGLSIKLRAGAARALFGVSAHELAATTVAWEDLVHQRDRSLPERIRDARGDAHRLEIVTHALQDMQRDGEASGWATARHAKDLLCGSNHTSVEATARAIGISERRLQQLFQAHLGLSPREWRRLARLHSCLRMLRLHQPVCWASLAAECGFSDQSHLIRDFRAICGFTPTAFRQRCVSDPFKTPC